MTTPIDYSWKIDQARPQHDDAEYDAERRAARAKIDAVLAAAKEREEVQRLQAQKAPTDVNNSRPDNPPPATHPTRLVPTAPAAEQKSVFQRVGWRLKVTEFFRRDLRKKRLLEEHAIAQSIQAELEQRKEPPREEPREPPLLPGAGLQKLKDQDEKSLPPSPIDDTDADMTRGDYEDDIEALPPMPGQHSRAPAGPSVRSPLSARDEHEDVDGPSFESSANQAMDEALEAADAPGNRSSTRPALPAEWRAHEFSRLTGSSGIAQQDTSSGTGFPPLPSAVLSPGLGHLPDLSVSASRPGTTRAKMDKDGDSAQKTPVSGKWFGSGSRNGMVICFGKRETGKDGWNDEYLPRTTSKVVSKGSRSRWGLYEHYHIQ